MTVERYTPATGPQLLDPHTDSWTAVMSDTVELAKVIASTEFVPVGLRGSVPKTTAAMLYSRELGLPPMTGLGSVHVINGKAGISAELMRALILRAGHAFRVVEATASRCIVKGRRADDMDGEWTSASYTLVEAERAGDAKRNPNYRSRPAEMLLARATTRLARMQFADVIHGLSSTEELEDLSPDGEVGLPAPVVSVEVSREGNARQGADVGSVPPASAPTPEVDGLKPVRSAGRRRPALRPRGQQATTGKRQLEAETVEAEVIVLPDAKPEATQSPDAEATPPEAEPEPNTPATDRRVGIIAQHFKRLGVTAREDRLWWLGVLAGRPIESSKDLAGEELHQVITRLERIRDAGGLEELMGARPADEGGDPE